MITPFGLINVWKNLRRNCRLSIGQLDLMTTWEKGGITQDERIDILSEKLYCSEIDEYKFDPDNPEPRF